MKKCAKDQKLSVDTLPIIAGDAPLPPPLPSSLNESPLQAKKNT